jgi:hypothetical protein
LAKNRLQLHPIAIPEKHATTDSESSKGESRWESSSKIVPGFIPKAESSAPVNQSPKENQLANCGTRKL